MGEYRTEFRHRRNMSDPAICSSQHSALVDVDDPLTPQTVTGSTTFQSHQTQQMSKDSVEAIDNPKKSPQNTNETRLSRRINPLMTLEGVSMTAEAGEGKPLQATPSSLVGSSTAILASTDSQVRWSSKLSSSPPTKGQKILPSKKARRKRTTRVSPGQSSGRWTEWEHQAFLDGLKECGREWKKVALRIPSRSSAQIRSHAQKYFAKLQRDQDTVMDSFSDDGTPMEHAQPSTITSTVSLVEPEPTRILTPSIQRNVERILANPKAVKREVEHTLGALRIRYQELQRRLQQYQEQNLASFGVGRNHSKHNGCPAPDISTSCMKFPSARVHTLGDVTGVENQQIRALRSAVASMGEEELIALHVLGGAFALGKSQLKTRHNEMDDNDNTCAGTTTVPMTTERRHTSAESAE